MRISRCVSRSTFCLRKDRTVLFVGFPNSTEDSQPRKTLALLLPDFGGAGPQNLRARFRKLPGRCTRTSHHPTCLAHSSRAILALGPARGPPGGRRLLRLLEKQSFPTSYRVAPPQIALHIHPTPNPHGNLYFLKSVCCRARKGQGPSSRRGACFLAPGTARTKSSMVTCPRCVKGEKVLQPGYWVAFPSPFGCISQEGICGGRRERRTNLDLASVAGVLPSVPLRTTTVGQESRPASAPCK